MAIHQFSISLIPRQPILNKFDEMPTKLFIDHEGRQKYIYTKDFDSEVDFKDDLTENWWKDLEVRVIDIEPYIASFSKQIEWSKDSKNFKSYGDNNDNDLFIGLVDHEYIDELACRINVAHLDQNFISHIFSLAKRLDCVIVDKKGNLFEPIYEKLIESIEDSNAYKFSSNPSSFLNKPSSGQINPE